MLGADVTCASSFPARIESAYQWCRLVGCTPRHGGSHEKSADMCARAARSGGRSAALALTTTLASYSGSSSPPPPNPGIVGIFTAYPLSEARRSLSRPITLYIASGSDGTLWFREVGANKIGRITTASEVTEFPIPSVASSPEGITSGPDGAQWFAERAPARLGELRRRV